MDYGHKLTDDELKELEKRISAEYSQAEKEVSEKLSDYLSAFARKDEEQKALVEAGEITEKEYLNWRVGQIAIGQRWDALRNNLAEDYHNANKIAKGMTTEQSKDIYALNYNYGVFEVESATDMDTGFVLYDKSTVERLMRDDPQMLPPPGKKVSERIKAGEDVLWNNQQIQSVMMQSLLQGEPIPKIANRLAKAVGDSNKVGAIRNARTMTTGAENAGRVDSYKRADEMGIKIKQMWIATIDERTRQSHRELDGQSVEPGELFVVDGHKIRYPGDPTAEPSEVYNCRCTLVAKFPGIPYTFAERGTDKEEYLEWKKGKEEQAAKSEPVSKKEEPEKVEPVKVEEAKTEPVEVEPVVENIPEPEQTKTDERVVVQGQNLLSTWERRKDEFDFAIEDIINAQGFDGLPQIVSADEFDKAVEASNFIAQRTYSAPNQEILDTYRDELYNGKWYVDCSTGGAQYGQGMYCAADYNGVLSDGIKEEMQHYIDINKLSDMDGNKVTFFQMQNDATQAEFKKITGREYDKEKDRSSDDYKKAENYVREYMNKDETTFESFVEEFDLPYNFNKSYIETLTLDPTAKIITVSDAEDVINYLANDYALQKATTQEQKDFMRDFIDVQKKIDTERNMQTLDSLYDKREEMLQNNAEIWDKVNKYRGEFYDKAMNYDPGVVAAMMGYDAINAENHGKSGSYTVILNRTKVIFKGE